MKYIAIIDTNDFEDFEFFKDGNGKYLCVKDAGAKNNEWMALYFTECEQEPSENCISRRSVLEIFGYVMDYWKEHAIDVEPHEIKDALIEQYEFTAKQLNELPPVTTKPKTGYISIDDVMSVFDDFMCGEVDEDGMNIFLEMLKDKAEREK